jgi:hypothetical protein
LNERQILAQHAILRQIVDAVERGFDGPHLLSGTRADARATRRVEAKLEQFDERACDIAVPGKRALDERLRERKPDLPQVPCVGSQNSDVDRWQARHYDQAVEVIVLDVAAKYPAECVLEHGVQRVDLDLGIRRGRKQSEVVHPDRRRPVGGDAVRPLLEHLKPHALEHRQAVGKRHRAAAMEKLEPQCPRRRFKRTV